MKMSDTISALAGALSKAQGMIDDASKESKNDHFKSRYADLASVRAAIREPLAVNDLAIVQGPRRAEGGGGVEVETLILHKSGEWISETVFIPVSKWDAHGVGSGITYGRRYGLMALLCIASDDDDGNAAAAKGISAPVEAKKLPKDEYETLSAEAKVIAETEGVVGLTAWWKALNTEQRGAFTEKDRGAWKKIAADFDKKGKNDE
jgi:hypothetical protein